MNPKVIHAQRACEAAKARQAVVVFIDDVGQYAVASYGETAVTQRTHHLASERTHPRRRAMTPEHAGR